MKTLSQKQIMVMRKIFRYLCLFLASLLGLIAIGGALFTYYLHSPDPELPKLTGSLTKASIEIGGVKRSYRTYLPRDLPKGAPLVLVMHGSGENSTLIRIGTGYGFERLADQHGFAVVYPNSLSFDWNDCSKVGDFSANGVEADDVGFLSALADKLQQENGSDPHRVFATGVSSGGFMSLRLALEAPAKFRAVAAVAANIPAAENFKCKSGAQGSSVMIMNGTADPIVPFAGGEVNLLGLFYKGGNVLSSHKSAQYLADLNQLTAPATKKQITTPDGTKVEHLHWQGNAKTEIELVTIHNGGHGLPQPYWRRPRLLGPSPMQPNGPEMIWEFFNRQAR